MFPIKALRERKRTPYVTYALIIINALVFIWELSQGRGLAFNQIAVVPCTIGNHFFSLETLLDFIRTMFLHASWAHVVGNMIFLIVFGPHVEDFMGRRWFLGFYILAGFAANLLHILLNSTNCSPVVGASGAISGLMGSYLLLYPTSRVRMAVFFIRMPIGTIDIHAFYMLIYIFLLDLVDGLVGSLGAASATRSGVAVWAHVGGFVMGLVFTFFFTAFVKPLPKWDPVD